MTKKEITDMNSIATAMTLSNTQKQELKDEWGKLQVLVKVCLLYTSPSPRDVEESRMPSSA